MKWVDLYFSKEEGLYCCCYEENGISVKGLGADKESCILDFYLDTEQYGAMFDDYDFKFN